jgi:hypothetical protein
MPPQSRAQRRRQSQRSGQRPPRPMSAPAPADVDVAPLELPDPEEPVAVTATTTALRQPRAGRRGAVRAPEPIDYSQDYASSRRDLIRIGLISAVLLIAMVALSFSGLI